MARGSCFAALVALTLGASSTVFADDPDATSEACVRARSLFEQGTEAVDDGRLADGRELLRSAAELCPILQVWFNLGFALRRSGFTSEAIEIFEALLDGRYGALTADQERTIREQLNGARGELGTFRLTVTPEGAARVSLDGRVVGAMTVGAPFVFRADAGSHVVAASLEEARAERRVDIARGQMLDVALELEDPPQTGIPTWVWVVGGIAIAAAAAVTIILLAVPQQLPSEGPIIGT